MVRLRPAQTSTQAVEVDALSGRPAAQWFGGFSGTEWPIPVFDQTADQDAAAFEVDQVGARVAPVAADRAGDGQLAGGFD
jgi:hypothetical protein